MKNLLLIIIMLSFPAIIVFSQNPVYKASKTMDYRFEDCSALQIQGEKASIRITGKNQQYIELKVTLVAKHQHQKTALNDLKYIRFESQKEASTLILKNFYESANRKIESNLSVVYELSIPSTLALQLQNLYGSVSLSHLSGKKSCDVSFGRLDLNFISGKTDLQLKYTNLNAQNIAGLLTGNFSKSDADIMECSASTELNMNYGKLQASLMNDCGLFRLTGNRSEVFIETPLKDYTFDLKTTYSQIDVFNKTVGSAFRQISKTSPKNIFVSTTYCSIKIQLK